MAGAMVVLLLSEDAICERVGSAGYCSVCYCYCIVVGERWVWLKKAKKRREWIEGVVGQGWDGGTTAAS
jgi:hypothetical protein